MLREFKEFIMRGNVIDLAVAVIIATAFGEVVTALTENLITPLIAAFGGQPDFSEISFTVNNSEFLIGNFINRVISFLIVAAIVFFFVVKPMNALIERSRRNETTPDPTTGTCQYCKTEISLEATRCPNCTSQHPFGAAV